VKLTPWMLTVGAFLMIAVLAVGFIFKKLSAQQVEFPPPPQPRTLPMAITDIPAGTRITRAHVGNGPWRADAELAPDTMTSVDGVVGRVAREAITAAQPLRGSQFYAPGEYPDLQVADGMRAVTVALGDDTAMVNGLIKPGQYVDVHLTVNRSAVGRSANAAGDDTMTVTLFEGVRVIAMNRSYTPVSTSGQNDVTLELTGEEARVLLLGAQRGTIALTFNPEGAGSRNSRVVAGMAGRVTLNEILGISEPEDEKPFRTENYRGMGHTNLYFEDGVRVYGAGGSSAGDVGSGVPLQGGSDWMTNNQPASRNSQTADRSPAGTSSN
jgi:pilus assembly protein CpaB